MPRKPPKHKHCPHEDCKGIGMCYAIERGYWYYECCDCDTKWCVTMGRERRVYIFPR